jgi:hypothetical protein
VRRCRPLFGPWTERDARARHRDRVPIPCSRARLNDPRWLRNLKPGATFRKMLIILSSWWRRRESNPGPEALNLYVYVSSSRFGSPGLRPRAGSRRAIGPESRPSRGPRHEGPARSVTPSGELWQAHPLDGSRLFFRQREQARYRSHLWFPTGIYEVGQTLEHAAQIS